MLYTSIEELLSPARHVKCEGKAARADMIRGQWSRGAIVARRMLGEEEGYRLVRDLICDFLLGRKLYRSYDSTKGAVQPWFTAVVRNAARDVKRRQQRRSDVMQSYAEQVEILGPGVSSARRWPEVHEAQIRQVHDQLRAYLSEDEVRILFLNKVEGMTLEEIAVALARKSSTVRGDGFKD